MLYEVITVNYIAESGLPVSHYNTNASGADEDYIYFGSADGLLSFKKGSLLQERRPAPVRITQLQALSRDGKTSNIGGTTANRPANVITSYSIHYTKLYDYVV